MGHSELLDQRGKSPAGRPQFEPPEEGGCKPMNVDPPGAKAAQAACTNELGYLFVRHHDGLLDLRVSRKKLNTPAATANEKLAVNQFVLLPAATAVGGSAD